MSGSAPVSTLLAVLLATVWGIHNAWGQALQEEPGALARHLQVRYADARLQLAETDLQIALETNQRVEGAVPEAELTRLRANVEVARELLDISKEYTHGSTPPAQLTAAETAAKIADLDLRNALQVNAARAGTISAARVRRLRIKAEMANIRVELWKDPYYIPSLIDEMQWQIDRLTEQVIELTQRIEVVEGPYKTPR